MRDYLIFDERLLLWLLWLLVVGYGLWRQRQAAPDQVHRQPAKWV
jgi:hypothetical protein